MSADRPPVHSVVTPRNQNPDRNINMMAIPVIAVKVQALALELLDVERELKMLPLGELDALCGECGVSINCSHPIVDAVRSLEKIRTKLLGFEPFV